MSKFTPTSEKSFCSQNERCQKRQNIIKNSPANSQIKEQEFFSSEIYESDNEDFFQKAFKKENPSLLDEESKKKFFLGQLKDRLSQLYNDDENQRDLADQQVQNQGSLEEPFSERKVKIPINLTKLNKSEENGENGWKQQTFKDKMQQDQVMMDLIGKGKKMKEADFKSLLKKEAQKIKVFPYHLEIDIISYNLITEIEKSISVRKTDRRWNEKLYESLQSVILEYMRSNPRQKRYRIKRIFNTITQKHFFLKDPKKWMIYFFNKNIRNPLVKKYLAELKIQEISQFQLKQLKNQLFMVPHKATQKKTSTSSSPQKPLKHQIKQEKRKTKREIKEKQRLKEQQREEGQQERIEKFRQLLSKNDKKAKTKEQIEESKKQENQAQVKQPEKNEYPIQFQKRIVMRLDSIIHEKLKQIMSKGAQQMCVPEFMLKKIYQDLGSYQIIEKKEVKSLPQVKEEIQQKLKESHNPIKLLELKLVQYLKKFPEVTKSEVFYETKYLMKELKVNTQWLNSDEDLHFWIDRILKKYKIGKKELTKKKEEILGKQNFRVKIPTMKRKFQ